MIEARIAALASCRTERQFFRQHRWLEEHMTPGDVRWLGARRHALPRETRSWLAALEPLLADTWPPENYLRRSLHPAVDLYCDPAADRSRKTLVLGYCGGARRLLMPVASVLSHLPSRLFDLVVVHDAEKRHFDGVTGYAPDIHALSRRLLADSGAAAYANVVHYGVSMGGLPALRGALLTRGRAVAVGGRFVGHVQRLIEETSALPAWDPICACHADAVPDILCVYAAGHRTDAEDAARVAAIMPIRHWSIDGFAQHNIVHALTLAGRAGEFYRTVFRFG